MQFSVSVSSAIFLALLYLALWLLPKTCTTMKSITTGFFYFNWVLLCLLKVFSFLLIGCTCCDYFDFGFTTPNRKALYWYNIKQTSCRKREKAVPHFHIKSRFIHLIKRFYYNASVNSHSQLSAYSKETHPKRPVVNTWNSAIYGAINTCRIHVCLVMYK